MNCMFLLYFQTSFRDSTSTYRSSGYSTSSSSSGRSFIVSSDYNTPKEICPDGASTRTVRISTRALSESSLSISDRVAAFDKSQIDELTANSANPVALQGSNDNVAQRPVHSGIYRTFTGRSGEPVDMAPKEKYRQNSADEETFL